MSLLFNMLSSLVIAFLPRSKHLLISWLKSPTVVILEPPEINSAAVSTVSPSICHEVMGLDAMIFVFWMLSFKPTFSFSSFTFIKRLFSSSSLSAKYLQWHPISYHFLAWQSITYPVHLSRLVFKYLHRSPQAPVPLFQTDWSLQVLQCPALYLFLYYSRWLKPSHSVSLLRKSVSSPKSRPSVVLIQN